MAILPQNAKYTETLADSSALPAGEYVAEIVKSEVKATKAGTGHYLALRFRVIEGEHVGRLVFTNLNYDNPNPQAVEIAFKALNSIKECCGLSPDEGEDTEELHGIPMTLKVTIRKGNDQYPDSNEIRAYTPLEGYDEPAEAAAEEVVKPWEQPAK